MLPSFYNSGLYTAVDISEKLDFLGSIPQKETIVGHLGTVHETPHILVNPDSSKGQITSESMRIF